MKHGEMIAELAADLAGALAADPDGLVRHYHGEIDPSEHLFVYEPLVEPGQANAADAGPEAAPESPLVARELAVNAACAACPERVFPVRNFKRPGGAARGLVLHYNGPVQGGGGAPLDRSREFRFGSAELDDLFDRMLAAADLSAGDLSYQEYPGCFFNPDRSLPEDWNRRCTSCLSHVLDTVRSEEVRLLLLTGAAAVFLLGEEQAVKLSRSGEPMDLTFDELTVPALVLRSPAAIHALERKRKRLQAQGEGPEYRKAVDTEKSVKAAVLKALKSARSRYLA